MSSTPRKGLIGGLLLLTGAIVGVAGTLFYLESQPKRPSRVLAEVKPELESQPPVYIGGISRYEGEHLVHYQFVCDIYTGQILDLFPVEG